jgi:transposase
MSPTPTVVARKPYPSDLTDAQWELVEPFVRGNPFGPQPVVHERREVVNAILYICRTGAPWRYLPHDLPDWQSVYHYFRLWTKDGTLKLLHEVLRGKVRQQEGRSAQPTAGILDSQSVKTALEAGTRPVDDVLRDLVELSEMGHPLPHVQASREAAVGPHRRAVRAERADAEAVRPAARAAAEYRAVVDLPA